MANTIQILGVEKVLANFSRREKEAIEANSAEARVGYTANYAVFVHEINKNYRNGKQWKYLERPARQLNNSGELGQIIIRAVKGGAKLQQALFLAALRIQRDSQKEVPVDTGNLKASAFTRAGKS